MQEIRKHEWFLKNLPADLGDLGDRSYDFEDPSHPPQNVEEIMRIIAEARVPGTGAGLSYNDAALDVDDMDLENDADPDVDSSGEFVCARHAVKKLNVRTLEIPELLCTSILYL
jgi:serine/threonine-protein kinase SRK2